MKKTGLALSNYLPLSSLNLFGIAWGAVGDVGGLSVRRTHTESGAWRTKSGAWRWGWLAEIRSGGSRICVDRACRTIELVPDQHPGGVSGLDYLTGNISGIVGPTMMRIAVQDFGGYSSGFVLGAVIDLIGVLAMLPVIGRRVADKGAEGQSTVA